MSRTDEHFGRLIDMVGYILSKPLTRLPCSYLIPELNAVFGADAGVWVEHRRGAAPKVELYPDSATPPISAINTMQPHIFDHPLLRWFAATGDPAAQSVGRVPTEVGGAPAAAWRRMTAPLGFDEQLSIPLALDDQSYRALVFMRQGVDFSDESLWLARRIQPLLTGLERQARALASMTLCPEQEDARQEVGLTGRELAVLALIAKGKTSTAVAHKLQISARTVEKHLEHMYAKLACGNRVAAVLRAQTLGLLPPTSFPHARQFD